MNNLTISLPEPIQQFIEAEVATGKYPTASDLIVKLVRQEQKRKAREKVDALLLEALESEATEMTREDWEELKQEARNRLASQDSQ